MVVPGEACPVAHIHLTVGYACDAEFTLRGRDGYKITVSADPEGRAGVVELRAEGRSITAQYSVLGHATADTIKARFGRLGRVSVRFEPSGRLRRIRVPKTCMKDRPRVITSRLGTFVGTIEFRGERGYTSVSARHATGGIGDPLANTPTKLVCDFHESAAERERELESVGLDASSSDAKFGFYASRLTGRWSRQAFPVEPGASKGPRNLFLAGRSERTGRMSILRYAASVGGPEDFVFDTALTSATVSPPFPFTGSGSFLRNPDGSTSWTGTLAVPLPGLGTVGLTGGSSELATVATRLQQLEEEAKRR